MVALSKSTTHKTTYERIPASTEIKTSILRTRTNPSHNASRNSSKLTLDEFRDALWDGLVRVRNMLVLISVLAGILSYVVLCVVLLLSATIPEIQSALIFYLVGAFTGTFARLIIETQ